MKKTILLTLTAGFLSNTSFAGSNREGYVKIVPNVSMTGTMNVRFNNNQYDKIGAGIHSTFVQFYGTSYSDNRFTHFTCLVKNDNPIYEQAKEVANNLTDGSLLRVYKSQSDNECYFVDHRKESALQQ